MIDRYWLFTDFVIGSMIISYNKYAVYRRQEELAEQLQAQIAPCRKLLTVKERHRLMP